MILSDPDDDPIVGVIETPIGCHSFTVQYVSNPTPSTSQRISYPDPLSKTIDITTLTFDSELSDIFSLLSEPDQLLRLMCDHRLKTSTTALAQELQSLAIEILKNPSSSAKLRVRSKYNAQSSRVPVILMKHLDSIGWDNISSLNHDMTMITIKVGDKRSHLIEVYLSPDYPVVMPSIQASLPEKIEDKLSWQTTSTLSSIYETAKDIVNRHQNLFDVLDDIDNNTCVLEPIQKTYAILFRRIAIDKTTSLTIDFNMDHPLSLSSYKFLGPPDKTTSLRNTLTLNLHQWSTNKFPRENLQDLLGITFPQKPNASQGSQDENSFLTPCAVCYTYALDISSGGHTQVLIPDEICQNGKCHRPYHHSCLIETLQSIPSSRNSFGTIFGSCPYCHEAISVRIVR